MSSKDITLFGWWRPLATAHNPFRHPKSGELKLHEEVSASGSGFSLQQIPVQVLINPGLGKRFRNELPLKGTCRERLGRSGHEFRDKVTTGTACREQPLEQGSSNNTGIYIRREIADCLRGPFWHSWGAGNQEIMKWEQTMALVCWTVQIKLLGGGWLVENAAAS